MALVSLVWFILSLLATFIGALFGASLGYRFASHEVCGDCGPFALLPIS